VRWQLRFTFADATQQTVEPRFATTGARRGCRLAILRALEVNLVRRRQLDRLSSEVREATYCRDKLSQAYDSYVEGRPILAVNTP
jgi:hypothetical protein